MTRLLYKCGVLLTAIVSGAVAADVRDSKPGVPEPVPPVYDKVKHVHHTTALDSGEPRVTIISPLSGMYRELATRIQEAIKQTTGRPYVVIGADTGHVVGFEL